MTRLLGIDLGTSSVKAVLIGVDGAILGVGAEDYPIHAPQPGRAEQDPEQWWAATIRAVRVALDSAQQAAGSGEIAAIGLSGQMHGTVLVDRAGAVIHPAVIWADQRGAAEVDEIRQIVGAERLATLAGTAPAAGFMAVTLRWLQKHDPAVLDRAAYALLPKDWLRLRLTGEIATEASDAASTALFDVPARRWSQAIIGALGLPDLCPPVLESAQVAGKLTDSAAAALGLRAGIPVAAGCADQPAQAVGNGLIAPGLGAVTIGTGGQVFAPLAAPVPDHSLTLHLFCHAPSDCWYLMGATMAAGLSLRWWRDLIGQAGNPNAYEALSAQAAEIPLGAEGAYFLPYLVGERAPIMDARAKAAFIGLTLRHGPGHMARAIMEGVAYSLRQTLEAMERLGVRVEALLASGGGLAAPVWRGITADVLNRPLHLSSGRERAGVGAALIGGIAAGVYAGYPEAVQAAAAPYTITEPDPARAARYNDLYPGYVGLYPALKNL